MISGHKKPHTNTTPYLTVHLYHILLRPFPPSLREYNSLLSLICKQTTPPLPLLYYSLLLELFSDDGDRCLTGVSLLNSSATTLSFSNSIYRVLALTDKDFAGEQSLQRRTLVVEWRRRRQDLSVSYSRSEND